MGEQSGGFIGSCWRGAEALRRGELQETLTDGHENISGEVVNGFPYLINTYGTRLGSVF